MKYLLLLIGLSLSCTAFARSSKLQNMSEAQQLGAWAGMALACNAGNRLDDYELIASRIIGNQAGSDEDRLKDFKEYATEKLRTFNLQRKTPAEPCNQVLAHFDELPIFKSIVYPDGSVKLPNGKVLSSQEKQPQSKRIYMQAPTD